MKGLSILLIFSCNIIFCQAPLVVEGYGELAKLSITGTSTDIGYLAFKPTATRLQGYLGAWFNDANDLDFGTFKSGAKIHFSTNLVERMTIYSNGSIHIKSLEGIGMRKVFATMTGALEAPAKDYIHNIQYSEFRANDADGEFAEVVKAGNGFEFVQHQGSFIGDDGVLVAPINLPSGVKIKDMTVAYINRASNNNPGNKFEVCLQYGKKLHDSIQVTSDRTTWTHLPKGGALEPSASERFQVETLDINFPDIVTSDERMYSILVRCEDCNLQFIRGVKLSYTYN